MKIARYSMHEGRIKRFGSVRACNRTLAINSHPPSFSHESLSLSLSLFPVITWRCVLFAISLLQHILFFVFANTTAAAGPMCAREQEVKGRFTCLRLRFSFSHRATSPFFSTFSRHSARVRAVSAFPRNCFPHLVRKELRGIPSQDERALLKTGSSALCSTVFRLYYIRGAIFAPKYTDRSHFRGK